MRLFEIKNYAKITTIHILTERSHKISAITYPLTMKGSPDNGE